MTFSNGVVWRAVKEDEKRCERSKGRGWCRVSERRTLHLILGDGEEKSDDEKEGESDCKLSEWLSDMRDVFQEPKGVLRDRRLEPRIRVREGVRPYRKAPYRLSTEQKEVLHTELKEFKEKGWIRPSRSE